GNQKACRGQCRRQHRDAHSGHSGAGRRCLRLEFGDGAGSFMLASSHLLRLASPVFNRMLQSGMKEAQQGVIRVDMASPEEFKEFYSLLGLWSWSADKVTGANVDSLLAISDYYQVDIMKQACEDLLLNLPPTGARLLQAKEHHLKRQYLRCVDAMATRSTKEDLEVLPPDVLVEVAFKKQQILEKFAGMADRLTRLIDILMENEQLTRLFSADERLKDYLKELADSIDGAESPYRS
ncbi:CAPS, partial [Symbiodinium sp. CCMP2456]